LNRYLGTQYRPTTTTTTTTTTTNNNNNNNNKWLYEIYLPWQALLILKIQKQAYAISMLS
jgi:hypothetical protein